MKSFSVRIATLLGTFAAALAFMAPPSHAENSDPSWQGFYTGAHVGHASARHNVNGTLFDGTDANPTPFYARGAFGGGTIGYNYAVIKEPRVLGLLVGLEGDIGFLGLSKTGRSPATADAGNFARALYGMYSDVTGRVGVTYQDFLVYAKGGLAIARITNKAADLDGTPPVIDPGDFTTVTNTKAGFAVGGGVEVAIFDGVNAKIEYLFMGFGSFRGRNVDGNFIKNKNSINTVKFGVNFTLDSILGRK